MRKWKNLEQDLFLRVFHKVRFQIFAIQPILQKGSNSVYMWFIISGCLLFLDKSAEFYLNSFNLWERKFPGEKNEL